MPTEHFTREHANAQKAMLETYWGRRGYAVNVWVEDVPPEPGKPAATGYIVRSDMIAGFPRNYFTRRAAAAKAGAIKI